MSSVPKRNQDDSERERDRLLLALLKTLPQPRPKRVRGNEKANPPRNAGGLQKKPP